MSNTIEHGRQPIFSQERVTIAQIQKEIFQVHNNFPGESVIDWAISTERLQRGDVVMAEVSPSLRCPESCPGCPDSALLLQERVQRGEVPRQEQRSSVATYMQRISRMHELGVRHIMFIGGTIDSLPELSQLVGETQALSPMQVSWFSDGIPQTNEDGTPSLLLTQNISHGWINTVATHVSMDYPANGPLPVKRGRLGVFKEDPEYSRKFKSQYGFAFAKNLIREGVRRVVINTTIGAANIHQVFPIYQQVEALQAWACEIHSPTEVLWTFSPWIWRPHHARGDNPEHNDPQHAIQSEHIKTLNAVFLRILQEEQGRILARSPRLCANSSGYLGLMADVKYQRALVNQDLPYNQGNPEMLQVNPDGSVQLDPMFYGPELVAVSSIFGYRDREPRAEKNPFSHFQPSAQPWFPNIVTT